MAHHPKDVSMASSMAASLLSLWLSPWLSQSASVLPASARHLAGEAPKNTGVTYAPVGNKLRSEKGGTTHPKRSIASKDGLIWPT